MVYSFVLSLPNCQAKICRFCGYQSNPLCLVTQEEVVEHVVFLLSERCTGNIPTTLLDWYSCPDLPVSYEP